MFNPLFNGSLGGFGRLNVHVAPDHLFMPVDPPLKSTRRSRSRLKPPLRRSMQFTPAIRASRPYYRKGRKITPRLGLSRKHAWRVGNTIYCSRVFYFELQKHLDR